MQTRAILAAALLVASACGDASGPKIGPPAAIVVATAPSASGTVKSTAGTFSVRVNDANGNAVSGATVTFAANGGSGVVLAPSSVVTDETGTALTTVTLGTLAGVSTITASVTGVTAPATATLTTTAGALAKLVASPKTLRLNAVGDTGRLVAALQDEFANSITGVPLVYTAGDPTLVSVDQTGLVRALRVGGTTAVVASSSGRSDTLMVTVLAVGSTPCAGVTPTPTAVGAVVPVNGALICLSGGAAASEYALVAYNSLLDGSRSLTANVIANGAGAPPVAARAPTGALLALRSASGAPTALQPMQNESFHARQMQQSRALRGLFGAARTAHASRARTRRTGGRFSPSASYSAIPTSAKVGDLLSLNTNGLEACNAPKMRGFRVAAIGTKSIVLADTLNPNNGFTNADYARFAAQFDTLVYPVDVGAFGEQSDFDANGKVAILFSREVNLLTEAGSGSYVAGFFFARDLFPKVAETGGQGCAGSNEGEMFYMLVPDPTGANGNKFTYGFVDSMTTGVIAHEFQHLINAGRRLYVNSASDWEDAWLNEGLSHIAEELLYFRESGKQARQRLNHDAIYTNSRATYPYWKMDASSNFRRLIEYLNDPGADSPINSVDDNLATRGATWSFLRYAVDRTFPSDAGVWQRFSNSTVAGLKTLERALQIDPAPLLSDFALANYLSDHSVNSDPRYEHKTWNYRSIFGNTFPNLGGYPMTIGGIPNNLSVPISVRGGSASYFRLAVPAGSEALLTFSSGQGAPTKELKFSLVRVK